MSPRGIARHVAARFIERPQVAADPPPATIISSPRKEDFMLTVTTVAELVSPRFGEVADSTLGPEGPLAYQASRCSALRLVIRRTDERGRPLSIFKDHRRGWKVENHDNWRHVEGA